MSEISFREPEFDPLRDAQFRGKRLLDLNPQEAMEALVQALKEVRHLREQREMAWPVSCENGVNSETTREYLERNQILKPQD